MSNGRDGIEIQMPGIVILISVVYLVFENIPNQTA